MQDVDVSKKVWGKYISSLNGKTTQIKPNVVARYQVKISVELMKIHKEVFLTCDIFFVSNIPFYLKLSQEIYCTAVNHLVKRMFPESFKALKEVYQYYPHRGFCITTVRAD